jgi:pyruvate kinase
MDSPEANTWDSSRTRSLIEQLWTLRHALLEAQQRIEPWLAAVDPAHRPSAINLVHYLELRQHDLRELQQGLAWMGVSSLGRAESHVLANVDKVLGLLHRVAGQPWQDLSSGEPAGIRRGSHLLLRHAQALFGPAPAARSVRIMVTLPSQAAQDEALVRGLVDAGMDVARINCAHDGPAEWAAMAEKVRRLAHAAGRPLKVLMDLGGPKLRTGAIADGPAVHKLRPARDAMGRVTAPARLGLRAAGSGQHVAGTDCTLGVDPDWLGQAAPGDQIQLVDTRGASRRLTVVECQPQGLLLESMETTYLGPQTELRLVGRRHRGLAPTPLLEVPARPGQLHLHRGQRLHLVAQGTGHDARPAGAGRRASMARIACTLPEALGQLRAGQQVWFDDGRIGAVVRRAGVRRVTLEITVARAGGERLAADKGINLPDTRLALPALTAKDLQDLALVARQADMVGLSFAQSASDVQLLRARLEELGAGHLGLVLKIETRQGFEQLPQMLLAAMTGPAAGVMIARGDLAVECGYERLAEVQEEILWACEAAHVPVVWATQVLETLAKTGLPSRAEVTDAAMAGRAECVMLNKGPHILEAMHTLNDILCRMREHQDKKRPLLRALKAWRLPPDPTPRSESHQPVVAG